MNDGCLLVIVVRYGALSTRLNDTLITRSAAAFKTEEGIVLYFEEEGAERNERDGDEDRLDRLVRRREKRNAGNLQLAVAAHNLLAETCRQDIILPSNCYQGHSIDNNNTKRTVRRLCCTSNPVRSL